MKWKSLSGIVGVVLVSLAGPLMAETRTYDVRDLLTDIPDYRVDGPAKSDATSRLATITAAVRGALPKASADAAEVKELAGQLLVTTDDAGHAAITKMLHAARDGRARQAIVSVQMVRLTDQRLADLDDDLRGRICAATVNASLAPAELSDADVQALVKGSTRAAAPRLTLFSGQSGAVETKSTGAGGLAGGFTLEVRATVAADGASVGIDLTLDQYGAVGTGTERVEGHASGRPEKTLLFLRKDDDPKTRVDEGRLLVLVRPTAVLQREIEEPAK